MLAARGAKFATMKNWVCMILVCSAGLLGSAGTAWAATGGDEDAGLVADLLRQLTDPLFWFGLAAQGLFFARFFIQWLISERNKRSTVPTAFWYFSLAGAMCWFIYGLLRRDLVIMLGALLSCFFYFRNLILIRAHQASQQPVAPAKVDGGNPLREVL